MEEEIDLKPYIEALITKWYWIMGAAILAGVVAFIVSSALPPKYQATALVAVTQPTEIVEFDSRIRSLADNQPLKAYPEIALSDAVLLALLPEVTALDAQIQSVEGVRRMLEARAGADPSLLRLTVTYGDAEETAVIANRWAELFVERANQVYGNRDGEQLRFYERQAETAVAELEATEQALLDFQARNRTAILENQLLALAQTQLDHLDNQRHITLLIQDIKALREQLAQQSNSVPITFADQLISLGLQAEAFGAQEAIPVQIQLGSSEALVNSDRAAQLAFLDALGETLAVRLEQIEAALAGLEPQILALQAEKQAHDNEGSQLNRAFILAEETYTALTRKVEEERITSQDMNKGVRLVSQAGKPTSATNRSQVLISILIMVFVAGVMIVVTLFKTWWQQMKEN